MDVRILLAFLACIYYVQATYTTPSCPNDYYTLNYGKVLRSKGYLVGSTMTATCNTGYARRNAAYKYVCGSDRKWHRTNMYGAIVTGNYFYCDRVCTYNYKDYAEGYIYKKDCNQCTCRSGKFVCINVCTCKVGYKTYKDGESYQKDCYKCTCNGKTGKIECATKPCNCKLGDKTYKFGETYKKDCNTCTCKTTGTFTCTTNPCSCTYKNIKYTIGQIFKDGCNTCTCQKSGSVTCTKNCQYIDGNVYKDGEAFKDGCKACVCKSGKVTCLPCPYG